MSCYFLSFTLNKVLYAIEVSQVRSILEYMKPVKVPCTKDYVEGLINLRGEGISVINLRRKLGFKDAEIDKNTRIVIVEVPTNTECTESNQTEVNAVYGFIVDSVKEVVDIDESKIESAPKFGNSISESFIKGIGKHNDNFLVILNAEKVIGSDEV